MPHATFGSVEITQLNRSVFNETARTVRNAALPFVAVYLVAGLLFASVLRPAVTPSRVVIELAMSLITTISLHLLLACLLVPLLVGIASLIGWRHVLARGCLSALLALLHAASRLRRVRSRRVLILLSTPTRSDNGLDRVIACSIAEQLCCSLVIAPMAPPRESMRVWTTRSTQFCSSFARRPA